MRDAYLPCKWNGAPQRPATKRRYARLLLPIAAFLLVSAGFSPSAFGQGCTTPPTWTATIWFPNIYGSFDSSVSDYVGGQSIPWFVNLQWNAPCLGTITITSDYGQAQGPETVATIELSSTTGTYDNGSPEIGPPNLSGGFASPPPVSQSTPWNITFTGTAGGPEVTSVGNATLIPLTATLQFNDNKIIAAQNMTLTGGLYFNADPSTTWFPNLSVQASSSYVSMTDTWPPFYQYTNETDVEATATESVNNAMPVTISAELDSTNGVIVTATQDISLQPPNGPRQV